MCAWLPRKGSPLRRAAERAPHLAAASQAPDRESRAAPVSRGGARAASGLSPRPEAAIYFDTS